MSAPTESTYSDMFGSKQTHMQNRGARAGTQAFA